MNLSFEVMLILGVIGFYLYDSAVLTFSNELIFIESYGKWYATFPSNRWQIMRKLLYFPNPLTPDNLIFRATWTTTDNDTNSDVDISKFIAPMSYLRILIMVLMVLLVIALPTVMFQFGTGALFLKTLFLIYFTILNMLAYVYFKKVNLGLDNKSFASLAFDSLACPPFAINLLRKISLRHTLCNNPLEFAKKELKPESFKRFIEELNQKVSEELDSENDENNSRSLELINYREKLLGMLP
jgi:hypothetical protein